MQNQQQPATQLLLAPGQNPAAVGYLPITQVHQQMPTANSILAAQAGSVQQPSSVSAAALASAQAQALAIQQMQQYGLTNMSVSSNTAIHNHQLALAAQQQGTFCGFKDPHIIKFIQ